MSSQGHPDPSASGAATAERGAARPKKKKDRTQVAGKAAEGALSGGVPGRTQAERRSFFEIYKRGQGYWTRVGTAMGGGALILAGADFLYRQLAVFEEAWGLWVQVGVPILVAGALGLLLYWVVGVNRRTCDFMIATEGEMKKVSWSSRREIIGSTKVVIVFSLVIAALLFFVDLLFMLLFGAINVLKVAPSAVKLFTGGD